MFSGVPSFILMLFKLLGLNKSGPSVRLFCVDITFSNGVKPYDAVAGLFSLKGTVEY